MKAQRKLRFDKEVNSRGWEGMDGTSAYNFQAEGRAVGLASKSADDTRPPKI